MIKYWMGGEDKLMGLVELNHDNIGSIISGFEGFVIIINRLTNKIFDESKFSYKLKMLFNTNCEFNGLNENDIWGERRALGSCNLLSDHRRR